jgi:polar amino acid transport system substrate-binding protein
MRAGKPALVEKPLCITTDEFEKIKQTQSQTKLPIIVGFNRRYAPLVLAMKKKMNELGGPFVINYRVNAGFVPASKWSQDPNRGGGRIIHECCHFMDLFNFLLGPGEPRISVEVAGITGVKTVAQDNVSVSLRYPDGSLANLLYVAMGSKAMDRERIEVFADKTSMVLDDFEELAIYSGSTEKIKLPRGDKGHNAELAQIARLLRGKESSVISTEDVFRATDLTFKVDEAARGRSPPPQGASSPPGELSAPKAPSKTWLAR